MAKRKPTNPLTVIRTGTGDSGTTFLRTPGIPKDDALVDFVGTLDEACAALALCEIGFDFGSSEEYVIQQEFGRLFHKAVESFFIIGALVHSPESKLEHLSKLEKIQNDMEEVMRQVVDGEYVDPLSGFIVPNEENADLFLARAIIRRAEREAVRCNETDFISYLNTLSDFIFVLSWYESRFYETWDGLNAPTETDKPSKIQMKSSHMRAI